MASPRYFTKSRFHLALDCLTMNKYLIFILVLLFTACTTVKYPTSRAQYNRKCRGFKKPFVNMMGMGILQGENSIYIQLNPKETGKQLFKNRRDGVMLEIIGKSQFACDTISPGPDQKVYGYLLDPVFKKDIFKNQWDHPIYENAFIFKAGTAPDGLERVDHEVNILFIKRRYICQKAILTYIPSNRLDLLETGLYPFELLEDSLRAITEKGLTSEFILQFQQGQSKIEDKQIKLLLQEIKSIKNIQKFTVTGYASIEGSRKINRKLFDGRAEKVVQEIRNTFPGIAVEKHADENWEDFIQDIEGTPYAFLAGRNKSAIKKLMNKGGLFEELEPLLENHRKVVIEVKARLAVEDWNEEEIRKQYENAYQEVDLSRLLFIQQQVMKRIRDYELPEKFAKELNVPMESHFGAVLQNQLINLYELKFKDLSETHAGMEQLYKLMPADPHVMYNLAALKLMLLTTRPAEINLNELDNLMYRINQTNLNPVLKQRLKVNYIMIKVAEEYGKGERHKVNKLLSGIRSAYKGADYSEAELLRLSNYFESYGNRKYAEETLYPVIKEGTGNKELIFFYVLITLENTKLNKQPWYHDLMKKAFSMDQKRFCKIFDGPKNGGISFQLLRFPAVKERVCDWCE